VCTAIANPVSSTGQRDMAFLIRESAEEYHARSKEFLTGHQLADFRRCPALYRKRKLGPVGDEDRPAHLIDRALRTLVLKGRDQFEAEYAVGGPINPQTGEMFGPTTREFAEWAEVQGKAALPHGAHMSSNSVATNLPLLATVQNMQHISHRKDTPFRVVLAQSATICNQFVVRHTLHDVCARGQGD